MTHDPRDEFRRRKSDMSNTLGRFPNVSAAAEFDFLSQTIQLNDLLALPLLHDLSDGLLLSRREALCTVMHEHTHWADLVGTLWGQRYLTQAYGALNAAANAQKNGKEEDLWRLMALHDEHRRLRLPQYYTVVNPNAASHDARRPWRYRTSVGLEFRPTGHLDPERPIFFVRFDDHEDGTLIARQPLTVGALFETTAVWTEIVQGAEILALSKPDEALVEESSWRRALMNRVYDPDLALYFAPAHLLSIHAGVTDLTLTFQLASRLAHLLLNLPTDVLKHLRHPESLRAEIDPARLQAFLDQHDLGYAFAALCMHGSTWTSSMTADTWVAETLAKAGLPSETNLRAWAAYDWTRLLSVQPSGPYDDVLAYLQEIGLKIFEARNSGLDAALTVTKWSSWDLPFPPVFDADGNVFALGEATVSGTRFDPQQMFEASWELTKATNNFLSACR